MIIVRHSWHIVCSLTSHVSFDSVVPIRASTCCGRGTMFLFTIACVVSAVSCALLFIADLACRTSISSGSGARRWSWSPGNYKAINDFTVTSHACSFPNRFTCRQYLPLVVPMYGSSFEVFTHFTHAHFIFLHNAV